MGFFRRYYNQNRKKIWSTVIIVAFAFIFIRLLLSVIQGNIDNNNQTTIEANQKSISTNTSKVTSNKSVITGNTISSAELQSSTKVIDEFINYCNEKELEKAYGLLTDKCKEEMYSSLENFEKSYYEDVFGGESKICNIENWANNTYRVKIMNDSLSTGKSNNGYSKEDYITIERVEDDYKININNFIGYKEIKNTTETEDVKIEVLGKSIYKDYEKYTIKVTNSTQKTAVLDDLSSSKTLYLKDSNDVKYYCYNHELSRSMLTVKPGQTKEVTIKFYNSYTSNRKIEGIVFSHFSFYDGELSEEIIFNANI